MPAPARIAPAPAVRTAAAAAGSGPVPGLDAGRPAPDAVLVDVVVLTADMGLFHAIKDAIGERNPVWRARSAEEAADLLITGRCGVLLIDTAAVSVQADTLIEQIDRQFPETVVCVAGTRDDEPLLAPLISGGLVYRFIHKPASARRAGMFLQAAIKRHVEHRGNKADNALLPLLRSLTRPRAPIPRRYLLGFALACLAVIALGFLRAQFADTAPAAVQQLAGPLPDPIPAAASNRSDPVLSRARAALQAGRLESPEGRNALDLFEAVLLAQPAHAEARAGLDKTIDLLVERARKQADAGHRPEAERILQRILAVNPRHPGAKALVEKVSPPDLPSRQLVREQVAEVRQRASEPRATASLPDVQRPPSTAPAGPLPEPVSSAYLARARAEARPTKPVAARAVVATDPLTPRYLNEPPPKRVASWRTQPPPTGASMPAGLPTAGLASDVANAPAARPALAGPTLPADEFDRIVAPDPVYPAQALRERTHGWVALEFTITGSGDVSDIQVRGAQPIGVFEDAASEALARWRFRPRLVNGQPVAQRSTITLRFDVDD